MKTKVIRDDQKVSNVAVIEVNSNKEIVVRVYDEKGSAKVTHKPCLVDPLSLKKVTESVLVNYILKDFGKTNNYEGDILISRSGLSAIQDLVYMVNKSPL